MIETRLTRPFPSAAFLQSAADNGLEVRHFEAQIAISPEVAARFTDGDILGRFNRMLRVLRDEMEREATETG